jgi:AcrR family transcriptional regulator
MVTHEALAPVATFEGPTPGGADRRAGRAGRDSAVDAGPAPKSRRYRGLSPEERRELRRRRLLDTGLDLFGTVGYQQTSVERVCSAAGVTGRHFYDEFASREALLGAVFDEIMATCIDAVIEAVDGAGPEPDEVIAAGVGTYVRTMLADRRRARIVTIEVMGAGGAVDIYRQGQALRFADYMRTIADRMISEGAPIAGHDITPIALVGAIHELIRSRIAVGDDGPGVDAIADEAIRIVQTVAHAADL